MSRVIYNTTMHGPHWSTNQIIFSGKNGALGGLSVRHGRNFGATCASAILGPDLVMPGAQGVNNPTATGSPWDNTTPFAPGPAVYFDQDILYTWIRGHLINGRWGGPGVTGEI